MKHNIDEITQSLRENGSFVFHGLDKDIGISLRGIENELDDIGGYYSQTAVEKQIFRPRENHEGRTGDACMTSIGNPEYAPFIRLNQYDNLSKLQSLYNDILSSYFNEDMTNSKSLMNWQRYKQGCDNSLPFHADCEIFSGNWGKGYIDLERGLIPKFVMVLVTTNENDGAGLQLLINGVESELELHPGDMVIFDNTKLLHGVPRSTPNKRNMVGFRNFEAHPLYFQKTEFIHSNSYSNGLVNGFVKELSTEEAITILKEEGIIYD